MTKNGLPGRRVIRTENLSQQPDWRKHPDYQHVLSALRRLPPLIPEAEVARARRAMRAVALGEAVVLQAGDCAERFGDCTDEHVRSVCDVLTGLSQVLGERAGRSCFPVARIGGQFAKPRSRDTEVVDGQTIGTFRGHMINSEADTETARRHEPGRMLTAYEASARVLDALRGLSEEESGSQVAWTSHEALVLDYEMPQRVYGPGGDRFYLASTHLPWIGARTGGAGSVHVRFLASVSNAVAMKVPGWIDPADLAASCARLDPEREPGRLALVFRLGRREVEQVMPPLLAAVRRGGHTPALLCDPMHANTVRTAGGTKTRLVADICAEVDGFRAVCHASGVHAGGLHLEVAADDVTECIGGTVADEDALRDRYRSLCDPRLNPNQAAEVVGRWAAAG